jgi:predicted ester cyclase
MKSRRFIVTFVTLFSFSLFSFSFVRAQDSEPACEGDYLESVRELGLIYIEALNAGDLDPWYEVLADDYQAFYPSGAGLDKDAARASDEALLAAFPGFQTEIHESSVSSDCRFVTFHWTSSGEFTGTMGDVEPTGLPATVPGITIVEVADGQIVSERVSYDQLALLTQIGVIGGGEAGSLTEEFANTFVERFDMIFDGVENLDIANEIFAPDFVGHLPLAPELDVEGWKAYVASFWAGAPDSRQEVNQIIVAGDRLIIHVTYVGTHTDTLFGIPATGNPISMDGIGIFTFNEEGLATENWAVLDLAAVYAQIGAFPPAQ